MNLTDLPFADEVTKLMSDAREMAIGLGYDYIDTIHIFLADCESDSPYSVYDFCFGENPERYFDFKNAYKKAEAGHLDFAGESLPLTKEAEKAIMQSIVQRIKHRQQKVHPWHIMLSAMNDKNSAIAKCFPEEDVAERLVNYYKKNGAFETDKDKNYGHTPETEKPSSTLIGKIFRFIKPRKPG